MIQMNDTYHTIFVPKDLGEEESNGEGVENCVTKNLYQDLFTPPADSDEAISNTKMADNCNAYRSFVSPRHLELSENRLSGDRLGQACKQVESLDQFKTPKGKLNLVINFAKIISVML